MAHSKVTAYLLNFNFYVQSSHDPEKANLICEKLFEKFKRTLANLSMQTVDEMSNVEVEEDLSFVLDDEIEDVDTER